MNATDFCVDVSTQWSIYHINIAWRQLLGFFIELEFHESIVLIMFVRLLQVNATDIHGWQVNIGSGNVLVPSSNKPLSEQLKLNEFREAMWCY